MKKNQSMEEHLFYRISSVVYHALLMNLYFFISCIFCIFVFYVVDISWKFIIPIIGAIFIFYHAICSLFRFVVNYLQVEQLCTFKTYLICWKKSFRYTLPSFFMFLSIQSVFLVDLIYFSKLSINNILLPLVLILNFILLMIIVQSFYYQAQNKDTQFILILKYTFFKTFSSLSLFFSGLLNCGLFFLFVAIVLLKPLMGLLFFPIVYIVLVYFLLSKKTLLKEGL